MKTTIRVALVVGTLALAGCSMSWNLPPASSAPGADQLPSTSTAVSFRDLRATSAVIATEDDLRQSIAAHQQFVGKHPGHVEALSDLAGQQLLLGTAYCDRRSAKKTAFLKAKQAAEQAMSTDSGYARRTRQGAPPWEACDELGMKHMDAMLSWVTSVLYMFREGMVFPQQIVESEWLDHAGRMLRHGMSIDRKWSGGAWLFSQAIVYHSVPPVAGGDPAKAQQYLAESVDVGGDWMLPRWGRAKYFLTDPADSKAREADLRAVLALDPATPREAPYWRRYFQAEARRMLAEDGHAPE